MYTIRKIEANVSKCVKSFVVVIKFNDYKEDTVFYISEPNLNYDYLVSNLIKVKYTNDRMQAIINNYLLEQDEQTIAEFNEMQDWRKLSKTVAKDILSNVN